MTPPPPHGRIGGKAEWAPAPSPPCSLGLGCRRSSCQYAGRGRSVATWLPMPTMMVATNAESGRSALTMLQLTRKPDYGLSFRGLCGTVAPKAM